MILPDQPLSTWPCYSPEEVEAVSGVLKSGKVNYWTGDEGRAFEHEFAQWVGVRHAVALANGTLALEAALEALGVAAGDEVITTPRSFIATASAIVRVGATPVFADVEPESQNISAETIEPMITERTRAVIAVHLSGQPCDMDPILALARRYDLKILEDCAQAHGARYRGRTVGSIGHIAAWSFCQDKIMTTGGEGGMVTTDDESLWNRVWSLKDHGKDHAKMRRTDHPPGFRWLHDSIGSNYRMTEMQAALGRVQLGKMALWQRCRAANAAILQAAVDRCALLQGRTGPCSKTCPPGCQGCTHGNYKFAITIDPERLAAGWDRDRILLELAGLGVPCLAGYCPEIYRERAFLELLGANPERLPQAVALGRTSLLLLIHPTLTVDEMDLCAAALEAVCARATR